MWTRQVVKPAVTQKNIIWFKITRHFWKQSRWWRIVNPWRVTTGSELLECLFIFLSTSGSIIYGSDLRKVNKKNKHKNIFRIGLKKWLKKFFFIYSWWPVHNLCYITTPPHRYTVKKNLIWYPQQNRPPLRDKIIKFISKKKFHIC